MKIEERPEDIFFIDIETVPQNKSFDLLDPTMALLWEKKSSYFRKDSEMSAEEVYERAGIYAEFGKIVCISVGYVEASTPVKLRLKSYYGDDEKSLLEGFSSLLKKYPGRTLCAHNGKEFDFPYIARRMIINRIKLPSVLDIAGKKPWEVKLLDTMDLWKFGDYKHFTSVHLLTTVLELPTPKDDIDGSMIAKVYYEEGDIERIALYCEKDVVAVARILFRFMDLNDISDSSIESVTFKAES